MPDLIKAIVGFGLLAVGMFHMMVGLFRKPPDYARATFGVGLLVISMMLSACAGGPTPLAPVKYRGCVNHDVHDFHGSNAQQDC